MRRDPAESSMPPVRRPARRWALLYVSDPEQPDCCVSQEDCDDGNAYTIDLCVDNLCQHINDGTYATARRH